MKICSSLFFNFFKHRRKYKYNKYYLNKKKKKNVDSLLQRIGNSVFFDYNESSSLYQSVCRTDNKSEDKNRRIRPDTLEIVAGKLFFAQ